MIQPYLLESSLTVFIYFTNELFQQILNIFTSSLCYLILDNDMSRLWRLTNETMSQHLTPACAPNVTDAAGTSTGADHGNGYRSSLASR